MTHRYHDSEFYTPQGDLRDEDRGAVLITILFTCCVATAFFLLGLFVGWTIYAPQAMASECGSVEVCTVRAEGL